MVRFETMMRDWLIENFPQYLPGQEQGNLIGLFLPTGQGYRGGKWVVSMRLKGTKLVAWRGGGQTSKIEHMNAHLTDRDLFIKLKSFIAEAVPSETNLWYWAAIV